ncbi:MAG TPA: amino acid permease, partial [Chthoniobacteraceae bacterium]
RAFAFLGRKNQSGVPARALWLQLGIVVLLLSLGSFATVLTYIQFALTVCSFFTVLGVIVLRFTQPALPRPYRTWGYPVTPLIFLAISLWMMIHIFRSNPRESLAGLGTLALGLIVYFASPKRADLPLTSSATP